MSRFSQATSSPTLCVCVGGGDIHFCLESYPWIHHLKGHGLHMHCIMEAQWTMAHLCTKISGTHGGGGNILYNEYIKNIYYLCISDCCLLLQYNYVLGTCGYHYCKPQDKFRLLPVSNPSSIAVVCVIDEVFFGLEAFPWGKDVSFIHLSYCQPRCQLRHDAVNVPTFDGPRSMHTSSRQYNKSWYRLSWTPKWDLAT